MCSSCKSECKCANEVDLSTLEVGDTVVFRDGGEARVREIALLLNGWYRLSYDGFMDTCHYRQGGGRRKDNFTTLLDILEIKKKPLRICDLKPGMALEGRNNGCRYYVVGSSQFSDFIAKDPYVLLDGGFIGRITVRQNELCRFGRIPDKDKKMLSPYNTWLLKELKETCRKQREIFMAHANKHELEQNIKRIEVELEAMKKQLKEKECGLV